MSERKAPFSLDQVGTGTVRFPSGAPIPTISDSSVDPYVETRVTKDFHVEGIMFWPQGTEKFPGIVVLHEWWGLNEQIKDLAKRLASEGYVVILPNLYGRQGGMVTANAEVAGGLMERIKEKDVLQDINSCCEFLNTRDHVKRNIHGVVGFGMGGSLAMQFACQRRRLRAAAAYYGKVVSPSDLLKSLHCPLLYIQATADEWAPPDDVERLRQAAKEYNKQIDIKAFEGARHAFCNETRADAYNAQAAKDAWETTMAFLSSCFKGL